jgi:hypothetical protein
MTSDQTTSIFVCSYCEQNISFRSEHEGRRIQCPKCTKVVWLFCNQDKLIGAKLKSHWFYQRPRLLGLLGNRTIGPIPDTEFLELVQRGEIDREFSVQSPEVTKGREVKVDQINLSIVRDMCNQRVAEQLRLQNLKDRENQRDARNRDTLLQGVRSAISDGLLSVNERTKIFAFAEKAGIEASEVEDILKRESSTLLGRAIEDAISDGFFDDQENENLSKLAIGLGMTLGFTKDQEFRLCLARAAWDLLQQFQTDSLPQTIEYDGAEIFEVVSLKRPAGIPLGNDHYLKSVGVGTVKRVDKNLLLDSRLTAKKYALSSIISVEWFSDGLFLKRSSGKSLFIRPVRLGLEWHRFSMTMEVLSTREPVVGILPDESFVPATDILAAERNDDSLDSDDRLVSMDSESDNWTPPHRIPRFTFRVVGEAYENRALDLNRLAIGEDVYLKREPDNPHDENAVAVINRERRSLGYLRREVSVWFAPILDRGRQFQCQVKHRSSSGGIIIAVYERG